MRSKSIINSRRRSPHEGIYGSVLKWEFQLNSPSFKGKAADPVFLENKTGWTWRVGPDQAVTVRFQEPLDKIIYEANKKDEIRTFFYADRIKPGTREFRYTIEVPAGGRIAITAGERYGAIDPSRWFRDALDWNGSPIDLSYLNASERPAGKHGAIKVDGDRFVFEDGSPARFWGANLSANGIYATPKANVAPQAKRMSRLGYNLMRIVQHDAPWAEINIFDKSYKDTRHLNPKAFDRIDWWIKCLKDEGIYVWLDIMWNRELTPNDGVSIGYNEIKSQQGNVWGYNYFNEDVRRLMREFQHDYVTHVNPHTGYAYRDEPAIVGMLITNENDVTHHFGHRMLPDKNHPVHNAIFTREYKAFARQTGLPAEQGLAHVGARAFQDFLERGRAPVQ